MLSSHALPISEVTSSSTSTEIKGAENKIESTEEVLRSHFSEKALTPIVMEYAKVHINDAKRVAEAFDNNELPLIVCN